MTLSREFRRGAQLFVGVMLCAAMTQAQSVQPQQERVAHYVGLSGLDHAVFRGANNHIYYQNFVPGPNNGSGAGYWETPTDLFSIITPTPPNAGGSPFGLIFNPDGGAAGPAFDGIVYLGLDSDIHLLSKAAGASNWTHTDLTLQLGGGAPPSQGNPMAFVGTVGAFGFTGRPTEVVYWGNDNNIWSLDYSPASGWVSSVNRTFEASGMPGNANSDPWGFVAADGTDQILYVDSEGNVEETVYESGAYFITDLGSTPGELPSGGHVQAFVTPADGSLTQPTNKVVYATYTGILSELYSANGSSGWVANNFTIQLQPDPFGYARTDGDTAVVYWGTGNDQDIHEYLLRAGTPDSGTWTPRDISSIAGAPQGAAEPIGYQRADGVINAVLYVGIDNHIHELYLPQPLSANGWRLYDVTQLPPAITIAPATLLSGTEGTQYSAQLTASGGTPPYTYAVVGTPSPSTLLAGLNLSSSGLLSGIPSSSGSGTFTVWATDANNIAGDTTISLTLAASSSPITIGPASIPQGTVGVHYSLQLTQTGGTGTVTYSLTSDNIPGLNLSSSGLLMGTPTQMGTFPFTVQASDSFGDMGSTSTSITIQPQAMNGSPSLAIVASHSGNFQKGQQNATFTIAVSNNGTAALTGAEVLVSDTLPSGLSYVSAGGSQWNCGNNGGVVITVAVDVAASAPTSVTNTASVTGGGAANSPSSSDTITITPATQEATIIGTIDTPINNSSNLAGGLGVTGWALGLNGIASVGVYRAPVTGESPQANGLIFMGNATILTGSRPDVATAYPNYPNNLNAGWGFQILTNELPGTGGQPIGNGNYQLHAIATDVRGNTLDLGTVAIAVNNAASILPFGAIDTPAQGATISGTAYVVFGWGLTPAPNVIPVNGPPSEC